MKWLTLVSCTIALCWLSACSEDRDSAPGWICEFVDAHTDSNGFVTSMCRDDGGMHVLETPIADIAPGSHNCFEVDLPKDGPRADTLYRCICYYVKTETNKVQIGSICAIPTMAPVKKTDVGTEPVNVTSLWRGGRYLNCNLTVMGTIGKHVFACTEDSISHRPTHNILHLTLRHSSTEKVAGFARYAYASFILDAYASVLVPQRDSIHIRIQQNNTQPNIFKLTY